MSSSSRDSATLRQIVTLIGALMAVCMVGGILMAGIAMPLFSTIGTTTNAVTSIFDEVPDDLGVSKPSEHTVLVDSNGEEIARFYAENRIVVSSGDISQHMKNAAVAIEDRRFYEHHGLDVQGLAGAFINNLSGNAIAGGSSITQQYVKNTLVDRGRANGDQNLILEATERSIGRKLNEARLAVAVERQLSKDEILTGYLNLAQFGSSHYGVETASRHYFSHPAKDLNIAESALLAGITQSPARWDPIRHPEAAKTRRDTVLGEMYRSGYISKEELDEAIATPIEDMIHVPENDNQNGCGKAGDAAYFCEYVINDLLQDESWGKDREDRINKLYRGGLTIQTTLDRNMQKAAQDTLVANIPINDPSNIKTALSTVEPGTGHIKAMAQNTNYDNPTDEDPGATKVNLNVSQKMGGGVGFQSGSTFKVFTLIEWLKSGRTARDVINSNGGTLPRSSWNISCDPSARDTYTFGNLEGIGGGNMTVLQSTKQSVNGSFVRMANRLDLCDIGNTAMSMGVERGDGKDWVYSPSMVLGANEVTPLSMATAVATLGAEGKHCKPMSFTEAKTKSGEVVAKRDPQCEQVLDQEIARQTTSVLKTVVSPDGTGKNAQIAGHEVAGKTGTANDDTNAWFMGYTPELGTAVWQGHQDRTKSMLNAVINGKQYGEVYGGLFPATIFSQYMTQALEGISGSDFTSPDKNVVPEVTSEPVQAPSSNRGQQSDQSQVDQGQVNQNQQNQVQQNQDNQIQPDPNQVPQGDGGQQQQQQQQQQVPDPNQVPDDGGGGEENDEGQQG
ncbi:MAG: transglycosylase domain-containing protein [Actinomycetaceae bacterium]|nr:transglycosylase domain-containing protein [Actinomycetaceae bacterium]